MMAEVFISYAEEDGVVAAGIAAAIELSGYSTWYFQRDSTVGVDYTLEIPDIINKCQIVVVLVSSVSIRSHQVTKEIGFANNAGRRFLPVLLGITHDELANARPDWIFMFGTATDVSVSASVKNDYRRIVNGIAALLNGTTVAAALTDGSLIRADASHPTLFNRFRTALRQMRWWVIPAFVMAAIFAFVLVRHVWPHPITLKMADNSASRPVPQPITPVPDVALSANPDTSSAGKKTTPSTSSTNKIAPRSAVRNATTVVRPLAIPSALAPEVLQAVKSARAAESRALEKATAATIMATNAKAAANAGKSGPDSGLGVENDGKFSDYAGQIDKSGRCDGLGESTWPNGERYDGEWRQGYKLGAGVETFDPQNRYIRYAGMLQFDNETGPGVGYLRDGSVKIGIWKDGALDGYGATLDPKGNVIEQGKYERGNLVEPMAP